MHGPDNGTERWSNPQRGGPIILSVSVPRFQARGRHNPCRGREATVLRPHVAASLRDADIPRLGETRLRVHSDFRFPEKLVTTCLLGSLARSTTSDPKSLR